MLGGVWRVAQLLSIAAGSLSLVMLIKYGWDFGLVSTLRLVLDYYEALMRALFGWAEPSLKYILGELRAWIHVDLQLYSHWKHVFLLMWLYFSGIAKTYWAQRRIGGAVFCVVWGGFVALASSIASGTSALDGTTANVLAMVFPIAGFVTFELGRSVWGAVARSVGSRFQSLHRGRAPESDTAARGRGAQFEAKDLSRWEIFGYRLKEYAIPTAILGALSLTLGYQLVKVFFQDNQANPNILILIFFVVGLTTYWLSQGVWLAISDRKPHESRVARFFRSGRAQFALLMLSVIAGTTLFIALNAGLKLAGL